MTPKLNLQVPEGAEEEFQWLCDTVKTIAEEKWADAELLIMKRRADTAELSNQLMRERDLCLNEWELRLIDLPTQERLQLQMDLRQQTIRPVKDWLFNEYLSSLRKSLHIVILYAIKFIVALFCAVVGATVHHVVAARIEHQFERLLWQYFGLVAFVFFYSAVEKSLEGVFEKQIQAVRKWGLESQAQAEALNAVIARQRLEEMRVLRPKPVKPKDMPTAN